MTMTNNLPEVLIASLISFAAGWLSCQFIRFRRVPSEEGEKLKAELDPHPNIFGPKLVRALLVGLFLLSTTLIVGTTYQQRQCNAEFRQAIIDRSGATADDAKARKENDEAVAVLVTGFLDIAPGPNARVQSRALLEQYTETIRDNTQRQLANERKRAESPYPNCGQ